MDERHPGRNYAKGNAAGRHPEILLQRKRRHTAAGPVRKPKRPCRDHAGAAHHQGYPAQGLLHRRNVRHSGGHKIPGKPGNARLHPVCRGGVSGGAVPQHERNGCAPHLHAGHGIPHCLQLWHQYLSGADQLHHRGFGHGAPAGRDDGFLHLSAAPVRGRKAFLPG